MYEILVVLYLKFREIFTGICKFLSSFLDVIHFLHKGRALGVVYSFSVRYSALNRLKHKNLNTAWSFNPFTVLWNTVPKDFTVPGSWLHRYANNLGDQSIALE